MTTYYKATRPEGTDFYSGTIDYVAAVGGRVKHPGKPQASYACCSDGVLHASDVPTETLMGGSWPCRLFEVTGRPVAHSGHKHGFRSLRVVRELPAHDVFGPQGVQVAALIEHARLLTADEARGLSAAGYAARDAAWGAAGAAIARLAAGTNAARSAARSAAWDAVGGVAAREAAWEAAIGLIVRDLINTDQYDALTMPWRQTIGPIHDDDPEATS